MKWTWGKCVGVVGAGKLQVHIVGGFSHESSHEFVRLVLTFVVDVYAKTLMFHPNVLQLVASASIDSFCFQAKRQLVFRFQMAISARLDLFISVALRFHCDRLGLHPHASDELRVRNLRHHVTRSQ